MIKLGSTWLDPRATDNPSGSYVGFLWSFDWSGKTHPECGQPLLVATQIKQRGEKGCFFACLPSWCADSLVYPGGILLLPPPLLLPLPSFFAYIKTQWIGHSTWRPVARQEPFRFQSQIVVEAGASDLWTKQLLGFQSLWCEGSHCWLPRPCGISQSSKFPLKAYLLFEFCSSWGPWRTNWLNHSAK